MISTATPDRVAPTDRPSPPGQRLLTGLTRLFALIGLALVVAIVGVGVNDILSTDRTRGGYEPPYTGYTGTPIQADEVALVGETIVIRGNVVDSEISCRTGMWVFDVLGIDIPYRLVSPRALAVHRPQDFCRADGFDTSAWDQGL
jgi:hypothetical protein